MSRGTIACRAKEPANHSVYSELFSAVAPGDDWRCRMGHAKLLAQRTNYQIRVCATPVGSRR